MAMILRAKERGRRGSATLELAILLPFLMFVFLITVDVARLLYVTVTIDSCTSNAALYASQSFDNQNQQWIGNAQYWCGTSGSTDSTFTGSGTLDASNLSPALPTANITSTAGTDTYNNSVMNVKITYTFSPLTPFPGIPTSYTITRTLQARVAPALPS
jgi:Flp pilus assembly protein TadG